MRPVFVMLEGKARIAKHTVMSVREQSRLKVTVVAVFAGLLWIGAFVFFYAVLNWFQSFGVDVSGASVSIGQVILTRLFPVFALTLFVLLVFSNVFIAFATLYKAHEVPLLLQAPVSYRAFFWSRFIECIFFSSWASAYLVSPLILAYGLTTNASLPFYAAALLFYLPYIVVPAGIGSVITLIVARFLPWVSLSFILTVGAVCLGAVFLYISTAYDATDIAEETAVPILLDVTARTQSPFLPSAWAANGILAAGEGDWGEALLLFGQLLSTALFITLLAGELAERVYYPAYSALAGTDRKRVIQPRKGLLNRLLAVLRFLPQPTRSLMEKDFRLFWRDPTQWSQFVIFFGIMAVYVANLRNMGPLAYSEFWRPMIITMNLAACTLILATLTTRFVFPLISLEGSRFWIIGLAPIRFERLVWQKFIMSVVTTSVFPIALTILSCIVLELPPAPFFISAYTVCVVCIGLSGLAVGLGALYPNFNEDNPARIVSGMGGTLNFLLSMAYIGLVVAAQAVLVQWRFREGGESPAFWTAFAVVLGLVTAVSVVAAWAPMRLGLRNLKEMEF